MSWFIKTYEPSDAASIARMWNESDDGWPGGFTGGVPFTEEVVRRWLNEDRYLDVFLVVADERVAAYCSVYEYASEPTAAYVALLNCHPAYWKRGFGRELLKKAVARATALGYKRLDLHTWPGNMRAVPLYKKTGFFWQPETQVHMVNFLPLILPMAVDYFAGGDWYAAYQRELVVAEDDITWQGMKVYPYTFQRDGRMLKVIIDRESRGMTALDNDDFSVACLLNGQELIAGMTAPVRWEIVNKTDSPLSVSLRATGEGEVSLHRQATLEVRDRAEITGQALIDRDIAARSNDEAAHKISSTLVINGKLIVLETGVRPKPAVEIGAEPAYICLTPGMAKTVHMRLKNNLTQPVRALVAFMPGAGLGVDSLQHAVDLPAEGHSGLSCTLKTESSGSLSLQAIITAQSGDVSVAVKPVALPVAAPGAGTPSAYIHKGDVVLENAAIRLVVARRGAVANLYWKAIGLMVLGQRSALGPPFYPNEFRGMDFEAHIEKHDGTVSAVLVASSRVHPGVTLERLITIDSSPVVTIGHRLHNAGASDRRLQVRSNQFRHFSELYTAVPAAGGIVVDQAPGFPAWSDEEARRPESLSETWLALGGQGFVAGSMWHRATDQEIGDWDGMTLTLPELVLPAYGRAEFQPLYLYVGPGDWRDVRRAWRALIDPSALATAQPRRVLEVTTTPSPLLVLDGKTQAHLHFDSERGRALAGQADVIAPAGWSITPPAVPFAGLKRGSPIDVALTVRRRPGQEPAAAEAGVAVHHELADEQFTVPMISLGKRGGVTLTEEDDEGRRLVHIDNGWMRLVVAPDFAGRLVSLERGGVNHLFTSYPQARNLSWMNPWHGGVSAVVQPAGGEDTFPGNPGRMYEQDWVYELVRPTRNAAIPWTGVRVACDLKQRQLRGLRLQVDYLTVGRSNVVAVAARIVNLTAAPFSAMLTIQAYLQPGGERNRAVLHTPSGRRIRRVAHHEWWAVCDPWAAVEHEPSGLCLAYVAGPGISQVQAEDFGLDGAHVQDVAVPAVAPHGTFGMIGYLAVASDVEQARLYRCLKGALWSG